ncbi:hypothetical protein WS73_23070 [Burkholderia savannae]|nr:hypothetical protein WS73_23070 [Burkholderia savannae]
MLAVEGNVIKIAGVRGRRIDNKMKLPIVDHENYRTSGIIPHCDQTTLTIWCNFGRLPGRKQDFEQCTRCCRTVIGNLTRTIARTRMTVLVHLSHEQN